MKLRVRFRDQESGRQRCTAILLLSTCQTETPLTRLWIRRVTNHSSTQALRTPFSAPASFPFWAELKGVVRCNKDCLLKWCLTLLCVTAPDNVLCSTELYRRLAVFSHLRVTGKRPQGLRGLCSSVNCCHISSRESADGYNEMLQQQRDL